MRKVKIPTIKAAPTQDDLEKMTNETLRTLIAFMELALRKPYAIDRLKAELIVREGAGGTLRGVTP